MAVVSWEGSRAHEAEGGEAPIRLEASIIMKEVLEEYSCTLRCSLKGDAVAKGKSEFETLLDVGNHAITGLREGW